MSLANFTLEELLDEAQRRINCAQATYRGVILVGPPGAGKGTQAPKLKDEFCLCHISTGDALRAAVAAGTPLGKQAKALMDKGDLVPDNLVEGIVEEAIKKPECEHGFILDGFPRTLPQAKSLDSILSKMNKQIDTVVELSVPDSILEERITGRWIHKPSGRSYHEKFAPPKVPKKDDVTGEDLIQRKDDTADVLIPRLKLYHDQTAPLMDFYSQRGILRKISANDKTNVVWERIKAAMGIGSQEPQTSKK